MLKYGDEKSPAQAEIYPKLGRCNTPRYGDDTPLEMAMTHPKLRTRYKPSSMWMQYPQIWHQDSVWQRRAFIESVRDCEYGGAVTEFMAMHSCQLRDGSRKPQSGRQSGPELSKAAPSRPEQPRQVHYTWAVKLTSTKEYSAINCVIL